MVKLGDTGPEIVDKFYEKLKEKQEKDEKEEELILLESKIKNKSKKNKNKYKKKKKIDLRMHEWLGMAQRKKLYRELFEKQNGINNNHAVQPNDFSSYISYISSTIFTPASSLSSITFSDTRFFVGSSLLSISSLVIFIIIASNRIKNLNYLFFIVLFILNINPLYVTFFSFLYILYLIYIALLKKVTYNKNKKKIKNKTSLAIDDSSSNIYDYIFVASNYSSLYAATLLLNEKKNEKCLIILSDDFNEEVTLSNSQKININQGLVDNLITYQHLLDLALLNKKNEEDFSTLPIEQITKDRVLLKPLGTSEYGYTHSIIKFSNESPFNYKKTNKMSYSVQLDGTSKEEQQEPNKDNEGEDQIEINYYDKENIDNKLIPLNSFSCRIGNKSFINDFSLFLSLPYPFINEIVTNTSKIINPITDNFLRTRIIREVKKIHDTLTNNASSLSVSEPFKNPESPEYFLSTTLPDYLKSFSTSISMHSLASLVSIINCLGGSTTSLINASSLISLTHLVSRVQYGLYTPENGMSDLKSKLLKKIENNGGTIIETSNIECFELEELDIENNLLNQKYKINGVTVNNSKSSMSPQTYFARKKVVSGLPLLTTLSLLPDDSFSEKTKKIVSSLSEDRPILKVVLSYKKSDPRIKVEPINYYQVNPYIYLTGDDHLLDHYKENKLAQSFVKIWSPSQEGDSIIFVLEFEVSEEHVKKEYLQLFPSDPMYNPKIYYDKKNCKTNPLSKDYQINFFSSKLKLTQNEKNLYLNYSTYLISNLYPLITKDMLQLNEFVLPYIGRQKIKKTSEALNNLIDFYYLSEDITNLVYCTPDLAQHDLVSEIQVGYSVANLLIK